MENFTCNGLRFGVISTLYLRLSCNHSDKDWSSRMWLKDQQNVSYFYNLNTWKFLHALQYVQATQSMDQFVDHESKQLHS